MPFAVLTELKTQLRFPATDTSRDVEMQMHLDTAERIVTFMIGPSGSASYTQRCYSATDRILFTRAKPVTAVTAVTAVEGAGPVDLAEVVIEDASGILRRINGRVFLGWYDLTVTAGWNPVQANQKLGSLIIAQHLWRLQNGRGRAAAGDDPVTEVMGFAIPNRALEILRIDGAPTGIGGFA